MSKQAISIVVSPIACGFLSGLGIRTAFWRQLRRFHLPVAMLTVLLQRAPLLRTAAVSDTIWATPVSAILRSVVAATALGAYHALAGATQFVSSPSTPATATVGQPFNLVFSVVGAPAAPESFEIQGVIPPGLVIQGMDGDLLNASTGRLTGTPTVAGSYTLHIRAWNAPDKFGEGGNPTFTLQVNIQPGAAGGPVFTAQPADTTVNVGETAVFTATASGTGSIAYQWNKDGVPISGANSSTLSLANVDLSSAGVYQVIATSPSGSTQSAGATLTVVEPLVAPSIVTAPANKTAIAGETVTFTVAVSGTAPLSFQWFKAGVVIGGSTGQSLVLGNVQASSAGSYTVRVSNAAGSVTTAPVSLTVSPPVAPSITTPPTAKVATVGSGVTFTVVATGTGPLSYQWLKNGVPISGATNATLSLNNVQMSDAAGYTVTVSNGGGGTTSTAATLTVTAAPSAPTIVSPPASQTIAIGATNMFTVTATGTAPLTYQWHKGGVPIPGASQATLSQNNVKDSDAGSYTVTISNSVGNVTSAPAVLTVGTPPSFVSTPESRSVLVGASVTFSASATGTGPLAYQWHRGGVPITGGTSTSLTVNNAQPGNGGSYTVMVSNGVGSVTSSPAVLTVTVPSAPSITTQPVGQSINVGSNVILSVASTGTAPMTFQWFREGTAIAGAAGATLALSNVQLSDGGNYTVGISNPYGNIVSNTASLTVVPVAPVVASRISNVSVRTTLSANQTLIVGLTMSGGAKTILLRAVGPGLGVFGVSNAMPDPKLRVFRDGDLVEENDNWGGAPVLVAGFAATGAFALPSNSFDAALIMPVEGGRTMQVNGTAPGNVLVEAYDAGTGNSPRLVNVSARNRVGTGGDVLIAGFAIDGTTPKTVVIRAVGPTLGVFGVPGVLNDPKLVIFSGQSVVAENDTWSPALAATFASVGAFALAPGSKDAAIVLSLPAGSYTAQISGADGGTGEALIEIYEYQP